MDQQGKLFERSEFLPCPFLLVKRRRKRVAGSPFLWFVSFGDAKEMNS